MPEATEKPSHYLKRGRPKSFPTGTQTHWETMIQWAFYSREDLEEPGTPSAYAPGPSLPKSKGAGSSNTSSLHVLIPRWWNTGAAVRQFCLEWWGWGWTFTNFSSVLSTKSFKYYMPGALRVFTDTTGSAVGARPCSLLQRPKSKLSFQHTHPHFYSMGQAIPELLEPYSPKA